MSVSEPELDEDGFMQNPQAWTRELAAVIAAREGIDRLSDDHWRIIDALRGHYLANRTLPVMRQICAEAGLEQHCVSDLLSDPRRAWRIAGLPNPGEEAVAYLDAAEMPPSSS